MFYGSVFFFVDEIGLGNRPNEEIGVSNEPYDCDTGSLSQVDGKRGLLATQEEFTLPSDQRKLNEQSKSSKESARPKSFSSFFQHLETKYFPYKQQSSHEPSPHEQKEENNLHGSTYNTTENPRHQHGKQKNVSSGDSKSNDDREKPKKQRKSMFKSLFLLNTTRHQDRSSQSPSTDMSEMDKIQKVESGKQMAVKENHSQNKTLSSDEHACKNESGQPKSSKR